MVEDVDEKTKPALARGARGRFAKGQSGNPAGRPPGSLNEATRILAAMLNGEAAELGRTALDLARFGKHVPMKLCLDPILAPLRKGRTPFALPPVAAPEDVPAASAAVSQAVAAGLLAPEEAAAFARMLESQARAIAIADKAKADRLAEEIPLVWRRFDLRVAVVLACHVCEIRLEGAKVEPEIARRCLPIESLGDDALSALRAIPDSPELVEADAALMAMHPPPADRQAHEIAPAMAEFVPSLLNYLEWNADRIDRDLDRFYETAS